MASQRQLRPRTNNQQILRSHDLYLCDSDLDALDQLADVAAEELTAEPKQQKQQPSKARNKRPRHVESDEDFSADEQEPSGEEEELPADLAG
jgi:hypothetical protein